MKTGRVILQMLPWHLLFPEIHARVTKKTMCAWSCSCMSQTYKVWSWLDKTIQFRFSLQNTALALEMGQAHWDLYGINIDYHHKKIENSCLNGVQENINLQGVFPLPKTHQTFKKKNQFYLSLLMLMWLELGQGHINWYGHVELHTVYIYTIIKNSLNYLA